MQKDRFTALGSLASDEDILQSGKELSWGRAGGEGEAGEAGGGRLLGSGNPAVMKAF